MILDHACQGREQRRQKDRERDPDPDHYPRPPHDKAASRGKTPPALAALVVSVPGDTGAFFGQRISNPRRDSSLSDVRRCRRTHDRSRQCRPGTRPTPIPTNRGRHARGGSARQRPPVRGKLCDKVVTAQQRLPQFVERLDASGKRASHSDDSNRNNRCFTHVRSPLLKS